MRTMNAAPTPRGGEGVLPRFHVKPRDIQSFAVAIAFKGPCVSTKPTHMMTFSESWFLTLPPSKRRRRALRAYLCMDVNVPRRFRFDLGTTLRSAGLCNVIRAHIQQTARATVATRSLPARILRSAPWIYGHRCRLCLNRVSEHTFNGSAARPPLFHVKPWASQQSFPRVLSPRF